MDTSLLITAARAYVRSEQGADATGHDHWHSFRVGRLARTIAESEGVDPDLAELTGILHDVRDEKFSHDPTAGPAAISEFLTINGASTEVIKSVVDVIEDMSFKGAHVIEAELSGLGIVVRDADRLEAIGAIGVARTFAYGGFVGRPMHDPDHPVLLAGSEHEYRGNLGTTVNHFHEKLLLLQDRLVTPAAKQLAAARHAFMEAFLEQFLAEWDGR